MEIKGVDRGRNLCGNKGDFTNPNGNVFRRNTMVSRALIGDPPTKISTFCPKNSSVWTLKPQEKTVCKYWMSGHCTRGDKCWYSHSWSLGGGFAMLAKLEGHKKAVQGVALPSGSDKLYSGSSDGTARIWDCNTGKCVQLIKLGNEVGCLITEGPWVFIGMKNVVKALNIHTANEFNLKGPVGQVYAMVVASDMLFAGAQNGAIIVWRGSSKASSFQAAASLEGHTGAVLCLAVGEKKLFSGSADQTIRVWDTDTLHCIKSLNGHADAVMSLLYCNGCLFSCSLDCTVKVWFAKEGQNWEVIYSHNEENGVLTLCGMNDAETKPVLFCSCNDNTVRLYELPSFSERGRLFSKQEVRVIERGPDGLFFTGDATGSLTVWRWLQKPQGGAS
ncbi:zinc finger CCCH domain-containing protein 63-like [Durio zibethinus]|uniref:Zinc finger CCCH domain-containing protein 63-like n=1 Tax=Durio zibethinus TaxID=66656 RepID=A0A6P5YHW2_DURZI|nr:zinc finger CCCH domain-containing protein 63-like [Durio zibethinus]